MPRVLPSSKVRKSKVTIPGGIGVCSCVFQTRQWDGIAARLVLPYLLYDAGDDRTAPKPWKGTSRDRYSPGGPCKARDLGHCLHKRPGGCVPCGLRISILRGTAGMRVKY